MVYSGRLEKSAINFNVKYLNKLLWKHLAQDLLIVTNKAMSTTVVETHSLALELEDPSLWSDLEVILETRKTRQWLVPQIPFE